MAEDLIFLDETIFNLYWFDNIKKKRINGIVKCVLATGQGYFITNDTLEMQVYLKSLNK